MPDPNMLERRGIAAAAVLALSGLLVAGCASTKIQAQWTDPQFAGHPLRGEKVLVVCDAYEITIKRICRDQLSAQVAAAGATPVAGAESDNLPAGPGPLNEKTLAAARSLGAKAILGATVAPEATVVSPGPTIGIGVGGFGGSGGWSGVGGSVGVSVPVGGSRVNTAYAASMVLTDAATARMMWTGKVTTPASQNINAQIAGLAKVGVEAAQKAGLF